MFSDILDALFPHRIKKRLHEEKMERFSQVSRTFQSFNVVEDKDEMIKNLSEFLSYGIGICDGLSYMKKSLPHEVQTGDDIEVYGIQFNNRDYKTLAELINLNFLIKSWPKEELHRLPVSHSVRLNVNFRSYVRQQTSVYITDKTDFGIIGKYLESVSSLLDYLYKVTEDHMVGYTAIIKLKHLFILSIYVLNVVLYCADQENLNEL